MKSLVKLHIFLVSSKNIMVTRDLLAGVHLNHLSRAVDIRQIRKIASGWYQSVAIQSSLVADGQGGRKFPVGSIRTVPLLLPQNNDGHAAICLPVFGCIIWVERLIFAKSGKLHPVGINLL
jgi:hypothetical protein